MEQKNSADTVRIVIDVKRKPVYLKTPYIIPIINDGSNDNPRYRTGQDLTIQQIMPIKVSKGQYKESEPLTKEQREKYPFVINPTVQYKVKHLDWLKKKDPFQKALYDLMLLSGEWAESKAIFNQDPKKYVGYFEDAVGEAIAKNIIRQERYDAESAVRMAGIDEYRRIALVFGFIKPNIHIPINASPDEILDSLLELCDTYPKEIKMCFEKYNKGIDKDIFILECIDANIIQRKDKGDLYYDKDYIGTTLDDVKRYLGGKGNEDLYKRFQSLISQKHGKIITNSVELDKPAEGDDMSLIMMCKSAIFDGNLDAAKKAFIKINKDNYPLECESLSIAIENMKVSRVESKEAKLIDAFKEEMMTLTLEELQEKIKHQASKYDEKDCVGFWDDKEKLIEYMVKVKFKKQ